MPRRCALGLRAGPIQIAAVCSAIDRRLPRRSLGTGKVGLANQAFAASPPSSYRNPGFHPIATNGRSDRHSRLREQRGTVPVRGWKEILAMFETWHLARAVPPIPQGRDALWGAT